MDVAAAGPRGWEVGSLEQQQLSYRSFDLEIAIRDHRGREAYVSFSSEQLDYSRTYTRFGRLEGARDGAQPPAERARIGTANQLMIQHEELSYQREELKIDGDADLLAEYFGAEATAQRIVDFARGLVPDLQAGDAAFGDFLDDITRGIRDGFEQAEALLGGVLPEISQQTRDLVDELLAGLRAQHDAALAATVDEESET